MNRILKIIIAVIAALSVYCPASAQGTAPLVREGVKWHYFVDYYFRVNLKNYCYFDGTKVISDTLYNICHWIEIEGNDTTFNRHFYLRQEGQKVFQRVDSTRKTHRYFPFARNLHEPVKDKECLLYDFSLEAGDTWKLLALNPTLDDNDRKIDAEGLGNIKKVDSVVYKEICGVRTKVLYVNSYSRWYGDHCYPIVEGVGCVDEGPFVIPYFRSSVTGSTYIWLAALEDMDGNVLHDFSGVNQVRADEAGLSTDGKTISVSAEGAWTVAVYGADGRKALQRSGYGPDAIPLDGLGTGIYVARLQTAKAAHTLKLVRKG